ncbi:MAG: YbjN domain-containing protein [Candidatus Electryoneaceae bacterium]|nr:YbjN domain-containing protein [Candidatus Electryoneaceae bacterium]
MEPLLPSGGSLFAKLIQFFDEDDWNYQTIEDKAVIAGNFQGKNGKWRFIARAKEEQKQFIIDSILSTNVPPEKLPEAAEYLTRANFGLTIGNFELDFSDGEVRYKSSIDVEGNEEIVNSMLLKHLVYVNLWTTDRYLAGLMKVVFGETSPEEAIIEVEGSEGSDE